MSRYDCRSDTPFAVIYVAVYKTESISFDYDAMLYALCALRV